MSMVLLPTDVVGIEADVFIETGSAQGGTVAQMVDLFGEIHTIEWDPGNHEACARNFSGRHHVHCHLGSSPDVLPRVMDRARKTLFFLDAHYRSLGRHEMDPARGECPLLAELAAITAVDWASPPMIIIDDAHEFAGGRSPAFDPAQWPTLDQIRAATPAHDLTIRNDMIYCTPRATPPREED